ncbi:hypothetical protein ABIB25_002146 [Nakamurella sp. UYEF19]|uniref:hypothetical protein n=1 Tax=Nakamurella sp. UYEF19 TaxID=1756392 RepID=UPI00339881D2
MTNTFAATVGRGRHRLGRPGLVPIGFFAAVAYRSLFASWRRAGKHRPYIAPRPMATVPAPAPAI